MRGVCLNGASGSTSARTRSVCLLLTASLFTIGESPEEVADGRPVWRAGACFLFQRLL